jgi:hypothetical protein
MAALPVRALVTTAASLALVGSTLAAVPATAATAPASVAATTALPTLVYGSTGTYVTSVQRTLAIRQNGRYDSVTVAAVKRVQAWKKLAVTGVVGATTWPILRDPTLTSTMITSRTARARLAFVAWQGSVHGYGIAYRESKGRCTALSYGAAYRGKWQMSLSLWKAYGGLHYAAAPEKASCLNQDKVAYKIWIASGWRPWGG